MLTMSLFSPSNANKFITHAVLPLERIVQELIEYPWYKPKPKGRVKVVQDGNDELSMEDDVFQLSQLVDLYRVALSNDLEENSNSCIAENIFIDVDAEELNDFLSSSGHT